VKLNSSPRKAFDEVISGCKHLRRLICANEADIK